MRMSSILAFLIVGLFGNFTETSGARINLHRKKKLPWDKTQYKGWVKDDSTFICLKKWQKRLAMNVEKYCLVNVKQIVDALKKGVKSESYQKTAMVPLSWEVCASKKNNDNMKVCHLKGKKDRRVSYKKRVHVPKACFKIKSEGFKPDGKHEVHLFQAAVTASECNAIVNAKGEGQGQFVETPTAQETTKQDEEAPTEAPTEEPTESPTEEWVDEPPEEPTETPTEEPTESPTEEPIEVASNVDENTADEDLTEDATTSEADDNEDEADEVMDTEETDVPEEGTSEHQEDEDEIDEVVDSEEHTNDEDTSNEDTTSPTEEEQDEEDYEGEAVAEVPDAHEDDDKEHELQVELGEAVPDAEGTSDEKDVEDGQEEAEPTTNVLLDEFNMLQFWKEKEAASMKAKQEP